MFVCTWLHTDTAETSSFRWQQLQGARSRGFMDQLTVRPVQWEYEFFKLVDGSATSSDESSLSYRGNDTRQARILNPQSFIDHHQERDRGSDLSTSSSESAINEPGSDSDSSSSTGRSKRRSRKQDRPRRSAEQWDPSFRGVIVQFRTEIKEGHAKLSIDASYHGDFLRRHHKRLEVRRQAQKTEAKQVATVKHHPSPPNTGKQCASCATKRTPLWRDAEDGTPLCNACGIRYKKYRMRCTNCWHIPKKDPKVLSHCIHCGHLLKLTVFKYRVW